MELHGKVISPNRSGLDLNGSPELLINTKGNRITLNNGILNKIGNDNVTIGFGYDPEQEQNSERAFMYLTEEGCKVGKSGTVSSKWHADKLKDAFIHEATMEEATTRFKLSIDMENTVDFQGTTLYPISFKEALADLTRTQKTTTTEEPVQLLNETPVANADENTSCPTHELLESDTEDGDQLAEGTVEQLG